MTANGEATEIGQAVLWTNQPPLENVQEREVVANWSRHKDMGKNAKVNRSRRKHVQVVNVPDVLMELKIKFFI